MNQKEIDQLEYDELENSIGFINYEILEDIEQERIEKRIVPTEFETLYKEIYGRYVLDTDFYKKIKDKNFTNEEFAALYEAQMLNQIRLYIRFDYQEFLKQAMKYDEKQHYDFAMVSLFYKFYEGKDEEVKEELKTLPENALTILLKGYYNKEDKKDILNKIFAYDPVSYLVFTTERISKYLGVDEKKVLTLNKSFNERDYFIEANTFKKLVYGLFFTMDHNAETIQRFFDLTDIINEESPSFEERLPDDVMIFVKFEISDVMCMKESDVYDAMGDEEDLIDCMKECEFVDSNFTAEDFEKIYEKANKLHLAFEENGWFIFPLFTMIMLDEYLDARKKEKEILAKANPGEVPYYKVSFNMTQPKGAIQRQFLVRYDNDLYSVCEDFLHSIGVEQAEHLCGFKTRKTNYYCALPPVGYEKETPQDPANARNVRPYEMDSDTALFTYDYFQDWDFTMKISKDPISRKDMGPSVLKKAIGYRLIPDAHDAFTAFYNGQKLPPFFSHFLKDEKGKLISRDVFFGAFKPEEVENVPEAYFEEEEE